MKTQAITKPFCQKRKYLYWVFLLSIVVNFFSCKKNKLPEPWKNNEVKATVVLPSGNMSSINATGSKALMGIGFFGIGTFINGTDNNDAAVYITAYGSSSFAVTSPGNYRCDCQYRPNSLASNTPIFEATNGSISLTIMNDHHMEGSFSAVCPCNSPGCVIGKDSVIVNGTFKGDY